MKHGDTACAGESQGNLEGWKVGKGGGEEGQEEEIGTEEGSRVMKTIFGEFAVWSVLGVSSFLVIFGAAWIHPGLGLICMGLYGLVAFGIGYVRGALRVMAAEELERRERGNG